ncbi:hypothetical protein DICA3_F38402 [Diutina catenulata]
MTNCVGQFCGDGGPFGLTLFRNAYLDMPPYEDRFRDFKVIEYDDFSEVADYIESDQWEGLFYLVQTWNNQFRIQSPYFGDYHDHCLLPKHYGEDMFGCMSVKMCGLPECIEDHMEQFSHIGCSLI